MRPHSFFNSRRSFFVKLGAGVLAAPTLAEARVGKVEVGVCARTAELENAIHCGFDYLEPSVAEIAEMDESQFGAFKARLLASPIRCESFNTFFRKQRVVGDGVDDEALRAYVESALKRCREVGGSIIVWGSSFSRNVDPGYPRDSAWRQMRDFLRMAGEIARRNKIVIAIEPLRKQESNIINTGAEALRLVHEVGDPNVKMIIDYYHLRVEKEDPEIIWKARKEIVHFHFANPEGRL